MKTPASSREHRSLSRYSTQARFAFCLAWLPDVNDPVYRACLADEYRQLAHPIPEEDTITAVLASLAEWTERVAIASEDVRCGVVWPIESYSKPQVG